MPSGFHNRALGGGGGLAGGERRPDLVNVAWECDWAHHASIGERRRRGHGGAPAAARVLARLEVGNLNAQPWELEGHLGKG
jgi:hypothetical protein